MSKEELQEFKDNIRLIIKKHCKQVEDYLLLLVNEGTIIRIPLFTVYGSPFEKERKQKGDKHISIFMERGFVELPLMREQIISALKKYLSSDTEFIHIDPRNKKIETFQFGESNFIQVDKKDLESDLTNQKEL
ncbi:MAG: hypothetical protein AABY22_00500 [Nanoarchaeota archaeon]